MTTSALAIAGAAFQARSVNDGLLTLGDGSIQLASRHCGETI
ncbi:hypothetical protein ABZ079_27820 [Streptomyces sp. NPDC006314]